MINNEWPVIQKCVIYMAMLKEAQSLIELMEFQKEEDSDPLMDSFVQIYKNIKINLVIPKQDPLYLVESVGTETAAAVVKTAIDRYQPDIVLNAGTCGGNTLNRFEVCIAGKAYFYSRSNMLVGFISYIRGEYPLLDPQVMSQKLNIKIATIGTDNQFANEIQNVDVCEMECAAIAKICYLMKVPFTAIKIVSDEIGKSQQDHFYSFFPEGPKTLANVLIKFFDCL